MAASRAVAAFNSTGVVRRSFSIALFTTHQRRARARGLENVPDVSCQYDGVLHLDIGVEDQIRTRGDCEAYGGPARIGSIERGIST